MISKIEAVLLVLILLLVSFISGVQCGMIQGRKQFQSGNTSDYWRGK